MGLKSQLSPDLPRGLMKIVGRNQPPPASWTEYIFEQGQGWLRCKVSAAPTEAAISGDGRKQAERMNLRDITSVYMNI
jgi:hypothetical protein